ncbi:MAG: ABC transporter ATP-binding protein [Clostridiales bacterium]|nr:ABC transporter ATP-binding protein [Clostridiales bacterium]
MKDNIIIKIRELTKKYGDFTAVNNLNLEIYEGEVFGLLGPNGAGKTTTLLMLLGLTEPTKGVAEVNGYDATKETLQVKRIVGYLPDHVGFYEDMTGRENLRFIGQLNGLDHYTIEERIERLLERVKLLDVGDKKVGAYSRGMKQRLGIADILMKEPKIIILDEPTLGLDPEGVKEMLDLIMELSKKDNRTILISSHLLHQIQKICDRVGIFVKGNLLAKGPIETLGEKVFSDEPLTLEIEILPLDDRVKKLLNSINGITDIKIIEGKIIIQSHEEVRKDLVKVLSQNDYEIRYLKQRGRELDDIYSRYFAGKE